MRPCVIFLNVAKVGSEWLNCFWSSSLDFINVQSKRHLKSLSITNLMLGSLHISVNKFLFGYYRANQGFNWRRFVLFNEPFLPKENKRSCAYISNQLQGPEIFFATK